MTGMSESIEKTILKETLVKLRLKALSSQTELTSLLAATEGTAKQISASISSNTGKITDPEKLAVLAVLLLIVEYVSQQLNTLTLGAINAMRDTNLYVETLERYSSGLDKNLNDVIEAIKKAAEDWQKQQQAAKDKGLVV